MWHLDGYACDEHELDHRGDQLVRRPRSIEADEYAHANVLQEIAQLRHGGLAACEAACAEEALCEAWQYRSYNATRWRAFQASGDVHLNPRGQAVRIHYTISKNIQLFCKVSVTNFYFQRHCFHPSFDTFWRHSRDPP